ncbi:DNA-directed RNA polymerase III subunit RPC3 [Macrosteles quadrilineatus]|uniref:DNA-directed RNA polymerase III subunit RPC3 n=1 Tax=Macrosteles quadrilineatus TaxID=74068 RepID=UPI0023E2CB1E|nr:DNA-directed RNA polymerase III subunit RPC3 [Macrosteles quadrilineatus]
MASEQGRLCSLLIREHFGEVVEKVSNTLHWGPKTLPLIVSSSQLPLSKVKQALAVLIKYGFVTYERGKLPTVAEYTLKLTKVTLMVRYPRYILLIKEHVDEESSFLLEELLQCGFDTATNVILRVSKRVTEEGRQMEFDLPHLTDKFHMLVQMQYLMRCPHPTDPDAAAIEVPVLGVTEAELFLPPDLNIKYLSLRNQGMVADDPGDLGIYWRINYDRFHQDIRDDLIVAAVERRFDANAAQLMNELLRLTYLRTDAWAPQSNAVPVVEVKDSISKLTKNAYLAQYLDQYLKILEESTGFVTKVESSSGMMEVNMSKAIEILTCNAIDNNVDQRFGAKAARIFRLVRAKKYMEQDQIQQLAMIPDKEAKQLTYKLLQENFLQMQELRKPTVSTGPNKTYFLFHVDLPQVARMVLDTCYKAMANSLTRRSHEKNENIRLIEKKERIEAIADSMREQGTDEQQIQELVDDWLTPPERSLLESVEAMIRKMNLAELQIDDTVFLLQLFTYYQSAIIRIKAK